ncbi:MAG: hypothetical protein MOB07_10200 [Acidobacteria bacterium]|nr:hypothetical protein [Acidobacteriota bacterium]
MTPEEKVEVTETTDSDTSAIHPFDRYMSNVYARKSENDPEPAPQYEWQSPARTEPRRPADNSAGETSSGSEKLRTEIIARAREADTRAREAEERAKQIEAKFKQEQALRLLADQRVAEIEDEYKQRLASAQGADYSRLELELALAESEAKLKQEAEARWLADTVLARTRDEARAAANSAALASEEAEKRIVELECELEARDRDIEDRTNGLKSATLAWNEAERRLAELENALAVSARDGAEKAVAAEAAAREVAPVIREAEARATAAENKFEAAEARLQFEIERRAAAEQKIQFLENEFKSDLEMDWARFEADIEKAEAAVRAREEAIAKTSAEHARREFQDLIQRLSAQLEAEQRARNEIERRLVESEANAEKGKGKFNFGAERRLAEMEAALKAANTARAEAERKLAEVERTRIASFGHHGAQQGAPIGSPVGAPIGSPAGAASGPRPTGAEPKPLEAEVRPRALEAPHRKSPPRIKVETVKTVAKSARRGGSSSSLLTLGLSTELEPPAPTQDTSRKEEIKLVGYVAAISLLLLVLIVLGLTAYRLL